MSKRTRAAALGAAATALAAGLGAYLVFFRRQCLTWGARPDEVSGRLPGDEMLPRAGIVATRAITIDAPPAAVWPWLAQLGPSPRGGAYTYDWIENLLGLDMHSVDRVLPEYQRPQVGDTIGLRAVRQDAVKVKAAERDPDGRGAAGQRHRHVGDEAPLDGAPGRPVEEAAANIEAMLERGRAAGLAVAVMDVLPWNNGDKRTAADIERLNALIRQIAAPLLPFHDTLADPADPTRMGDSLTDDGDHPSVEGHRLLGELAFRLPPLDV